MNKQTKMIIGVGVIAVAGYLIYKQQQKKPAASFSGGVEGERERIMNFRGIDMGSMSSIPMGGLKFSGKPCTKSPQGGITSSLPTAMGGFPAGTPIYECCKDGLFGTSAGPSGCANTSQTAMTMLTP